MLSRRTALFAPLAADLAAQIVGPHRMTLAIHRNTSAAAGFRGSLEGWAKAGIRNVEITDKLLDQFLVQENLAAADRVIKDLGATPVSCAAIVPDLWIPGAPHTTGLEIWKKRCELFASLGLKRIYCPAVTSRKVTMDDYKGAPECIRRVGDIAQQHGMTALLEFSRTSSFISTLATAQKLIRKAAHPDVKILFDCYHFYSGLSKFEDLDLLRAGEIGHVHFQDTPDIPREMLDISTRLVPGDGIAPLVRILQKLAENGYAGALSVELFLPEFQNADPFEMASRIQTKAGAVMRAAKVA